MKKWFAVILMCIMMCMFSCAQAVEIQDFEAFSNGLATFKSSDKLNFLRWRVYTGDERLLDVFEEYAALIEKEVYFDQLGSLKPDDPIIRKLYWYDYTGKEKIYPNTMGIKDIDWKAEFDLYIICSENKGVHFVTVYRSEGIDVADLGKRASVGTENPAVKPTAKPTVKPAPKPTVKPETMVSCSKCGGDGQMEKRCSSCNGSGDTRCGSCSGDGDKDCISCSGKGYDRCSGCGGDGENRCSSCYGSGKKGDGKRCFSCSGSGEKSCSSCSGSGKRTCSACRGSGDRKCTSCGGDGKKDCSICSGHGKKKVLCTTCSGSGKVKR